MDDVGCPSTGRIPPRFLARSACRPEASTTHFARTVTFVPSAFSTVTEFPAVPSRVKSTTFAGLQTSVPSEAATFRMCSSRTARSSWNPGVRASCVAPTSDASRRLVTFSLWNQ